MSTVNLQAGKLIKRIPTRGSWFDRAWDYHINGVHLGTIFKQLYPQQDEPVIIYRFIIPTNFSILPTVWQKPKKGQDAIISNHYKSKKECKKALKTALITQLNFIQNHIIKG